MWEGIPVQRLTPKSYLKSFLDASESHETSANLSVRAYFRQFSDWQETYFGHSQELPGCEKAIFVSDKNYITSVIRKFMSDVPSSGSFQNIDTTIT